MYIAKIDFITVNDYDMEFETSLEYFVRELRYQGRILEKPSSIYRQKLGFTIFCKTPERDALNKVKESFLKVNSLDSNITVEFTILGEDLWALRTCFCNEHNFLILRGSRGTPLFCGVCGKSVPLYKIPLSSEVDSTFYEIFCWNSENLAWTEIDFLSEIEAVAAEQLYDIRSQHNQRGISICNKIFNLSKIPCYYYLEAYENKHEDDCPLCGNRWLLDKKRLNNYNYMCDNCKLIA